MKARTRIWVEAAAASMSGALVVVTLIWPTWWESLIEASPDGGDGSFERLFALVWVAGAVVFGLLARRDWRRLAAQPG